MSKEDMIAEIRMILEDSDARDVEDIYWTVKNDLG